MIRLAFICKKSTGRSKDRFIASSGIEKDE